MSDTDTTTDSTTQTAEPENKSANWRNLEASRDTAQAEANKWRTKALETAAAAAGYDTTKGVTQSLISTFKEEDVSPEIFKQFAIDQGLNPHAEIKQATDEQQVVDVLDTTTQTQTNVQGDLQTTPPPKQTVKEQIAEAQKIGDLGGALSAALQEDVIKHFDYDITPQQE